MIRDTRQNRRRGTRGFPQNETRATQLPEALAQRPRSGYDALMSSTDEQPFLDAAGASERAELIRLQLALAKLGDDDPSDRNSSIGFRGAVRFSTRNWPGPRRLCGPAVRDRC
jgi:hypothetical protein